MKLSRLFSPTFALLGFVLLAVTVALAQSGGTYDLSWNVFDGGGATFSMGGNYSLAGTAGQPEAGTMSGGNYSLTGGFWQEGASSPTSVNLVSFSAQADAKKVKIQWVTNSERETAGYNLWRSGKKNGEYARVNAELVPPKNPGVDLATEYAYSDKPGAGKHFYKVEIDKGDAGNEWAKPVRVNVDGGSACTAKPQPVAPKNEASVKKVRVILKWESVACATEYRLTVRRDSQKGEVILNEKNLTEPAFRTEKLKRGKTYYWQVKACAEGGCKKSAWQSFTVREK